MQLTQDFKDYLLELIKQHLLLDYNENYIIDMIIETEGNYYIHLENGNTVVATYDDLDHVS